MEWWISVVTMTWPWRNSFGSTGLLDRIQSWAHLHNIWIVGTCSSLSNKILTYQKLISHWKYAFLMEHKILPQNSCFRSSYSPDILKRSFCLAWPHFHTLSSLYFQIGYYYVIPFLLPVSFSSVLLNSKEQLTKDDDWKV